ncbi:hypothetical protein QQP08_020163 [Theobroma cacao]|nr:hypothetical protein QQP08_020163 [Theobroma cacao]
MCLPCDFHLDVKCATTPIPPKNEGQKLKEMEKVSKFCPFNQNHKLDFFNRRPNLKDLALECDACKLPILGPAIYFRCAERLGELVKESNWTYLSPKLSLILAYGMWHAALPKLFKEEHKQNQRQCDE